MFTIESLLKVTDHEAQCTIAVDGVQHSFVVRSEKQDLGLDAVSYVHMSDETRRLIHNSDYERDFVNQLCRFFNGESVAFPLKLNPHIGFEG